MRVIKTRQILRAINGHYKDAPYICVREEEIEGNRTWLFVNKDNHMLGIVEHETHLNLHDHRNKNDTLDNPTLKLSKGKKVKPI